MNTVLATKWATFYFDIVDYDVKNLLEGGKNKYETAKLEKWWKRNLELVMNDGVDFGFVMAELAETLGVDNDSGLYSDGPDGTEDRVWVRAYAALMATPGYETDLTVKSFDRWATWDHTQHMLNTKVFYKNISSRKEEK